MDSSAYAVSSSLNIPTEYTKEKYKTICLQFDVDSEGPLHSISDYGLVGRSKLQMDSQFGLHRNEFDIDQT